MSSESKSNTIKAEVDRRRTFAIISHPDAGKTTLTEKLLLYGGVIREAGHVKAKEGRKHTQSDWMDLEKQRGISINSSVLQFDYDGLRVNLLDTPGHKDFSEDTYRVLAAVDSAIMLIDSAKGLEERTLKLFEVCKKRKIPLFTFINKLDREGREPLDLVDEIESVLKIKVFPVNWPLGMGPRFQGVYDLLLDRIFLYERDKLANSQKFKHMANMTFDELKNAKDLDVDPEIFEKFLNEVELLRGLTEELDKEAFSRGEISPLFFGSAINNFGVDLLLSHFVNFAPSPQARPAIAKGLKPEDEKFSAIVFKMQANIDPQHRDCLAFLRICSGVYESGLNVTSFKSKRDIRLTSAFNLFGKDRVIVDIAYAGDVIGIVDTSKKLTIGDTLSELSGVQYEEIPRFLPERFASLEKIDPLKRKQLQKGIEQLSQEGVVQALRDSKFAYTSFVIGVVGDLQFDVFKYRMSSEYNVDVHYSKLPYVFSRWVIDKNNELKDFDRSDSTIVKDLNDNMLILFGSAWALKYVQETFKNVEFLTEEPKR